jgi:hypothetical protein
MTDKKDNETAAMRGVNSSDWFAQLNEDTARRCLQTMKGYLPNSDKYCRVWPSDTRDSLKMYEEFILEPVEVIVEEIGKSQKRSSKMNNGYASGYVSWSHELNKEDGLKTLYWVITGNLFALESRFLTLQ